MKRIFGLLVMTILIVSMMFGCNKAVVSSGEGSEASGHVEVGEGESGDPSSPILKLSESWDGVVNGIRTNMSYDEKNGRFYGVVENTTNQTLKGILIELNLKSGSTTVVELGPHPVGDLKAGESTSIEMYVKDEPLAKGVVFDAWEIHPEAENIAGSSEANESHAGQGEASESHGSESGEEGASTGSMTLKADEIYDSTKGGGRLYLAYNQQAQAFEGYLENVGQSDLTKARVEIHLDTGTELGPTTPVDLKPGEIVNITLKTTETFSTWVTHAEFGSGEGGE